MLKEVKETALDWEDAEAEASKDPLLSSLEEAAAALELELELELEPDSDLDGEDDERPELPELVAEAEALAATEGDEEPPATAPEASAASAVVMASVAPEVAEAEAIAPTLETPE